MDFTIENDVLLRYEGTDECVNIPEGVTAIEAYVFMNNEYLKSVTIPDSVTRIGKLAFHQCSNLTSINIPEGVTSIEKMVFSKCSSLTRITLPSTVTSIGECAFAQCSSLVSVNIPEGVTSIEEQAFGLCSSLTSISIPESVTSIGEYAFVKCSSLTSVSISEGVTNIAENAFAECSSLMNISTSDSLTNTEKGQRKLFAVPREEQYPHLKGLQRMQSILQGITEETGASYSINATGMEYQFIPLEVLKENDEDWDADEFDEEEENDEQREVLERIICADTPDDDLYQKAEEIRPMFRVSPDDFNPDTDQECEIKEGYIHSVHIFHALRSFAWTLCCHAELKGCQPEEMTDMADVDAVVKLILSRNFLNYGDNYCHGLCAGSDLHVYYVPDKALQADKDWLDETQKAYSPNSICNSVCSLDELRSDLWRIYPAIQTLVNHEKPKRHERPRWETVGGWIVYAWCVLARAAREPFYIEDGPSFCQFTQITDEQNFTIRNGVLERYAGDDKVVTIPEGVTCIGENAFWGHSQLRRVTIPESVTSIGKNAFRGCSSLRDINIPKGVTSIPASAFVDCRNLTDIGRIEEVELVGTQYEGRIERIEHVQKGGHSYLSAGTEQSL